VGFEEPTVAANTPGLCAVRTAAGFLSMTVSKVRAGASRVLRPPSHTAALIRSINHPEHLSAISQGSAQLLDNGNTFVGWGEPARFSEFDSNGQMIFDATLPMGYDTYRAYRFRWPPDQR